MKFYPLSKFMFDILRKLLPGYVPSAGTQNLDDLSGYSPEFIEKQVHEIRTKLLELGRLSGNIVANRGDPDGALDSKVAKVTNVVGKVCENLKKDREDFSKAAMTLQSLNPLQEIMERLEKAVVTGVSIDTARQSALTALEEVAKTFTELLNGRFQSDDHVLLTALVETVRALK